MKPMFRRIADDLRTRIRGGDLHAGDQIPTLETLMADYGTTTVTVRRALDELAREGLTEARPTVGTFVRDLTRIQLPADPTADSHAERLLAAFRQDRPLEITADAPVLFTPPTGLAMRIGNSPVLHRRRTFLVDKKPIGTGNDYFALTADVGSRLVATSAEVEAFEVLDAAGIVPARVVEENFHRMPAPDEMLSNGWPVGMLVFVEMRTAYMPSGEPVACTTKVLPGDRSIDVREWPYPAAPRIRAVG